MTLEEISEARADIARRRAINDAAWRQLPYMFITGLLVILGAEIVLTLFVVFWP